MTDTRLAPHRPRPAPPSIATVRKDPRCFTIGVGGLTYGLPVEAIQTVFELNAVTPVPLAPREVLGLVNLRGKIVTAVCLRQRLRAGPRTHGLQTLAVGIEHRGESFALVVDEVGDVLTLDPDSEIEVPPHLGDEGLKFSSVHRLETEILPVIDLDWALTFDSAAPPMFRNSQLSAIHP